MYTGIVQGQFAVVAVEKKPGLMTLVIDLPARLMEDLTVGASVGVDGVCLTVTAFDGQSATFDIMQETLSLTTLSELEIGTLVNVERSAKQGAEVGGHDISGHVNGVADVIQIEESENNCRVVYRVPLELIGYIFKKGFIGLNGCSLTVVDVDKKQGSFSVSFIPETLRVTNHGSRQLGDKVNVEIEKQTQVIVDTVRDFLRNN